MTEKYENEAEKRWISARNCLNKGNLKQFLRKNNHFCEYVSLYRKDINFESLSASLKSKSIAPKGQRLLQDLLEHCLFYLNQQKINSKQLTVEGQDVESIYKQIDYFQQKTFSAANKNCTDVKIYRAIMTHIKNFALQDVRLAVDDKLAQLKHLDKSLNDADLTRSIHNILELKEFENTQWLKRIYKKRPDFFHACPVKAQGAGISKIYQGLQGDVLKMCILEDCIAEFKQTTTSEALTQCYEAFKKTTRYKILSQGQGLTTCLLQHTFFGKKTTSIKALEQAVASLTSQKRPIIEIIRRE
ncbi:MAG: hypothetical protein CMF38_01925 [Legionellaceae bacterium]|nr:hypothetical protein [Legionellaceae bacterium]|tara:strand:+ start:290 stop:1192 length:903 start_codon:yes stop_codon:yes gene_type:complete